MLDHFTGQPAQVLTDRQIALPACVATIGAFDGVHRGHQALIGAAVAEARALRLPAVVWTFDPPPKVLFGRAGQLCSLPEKLARIARLGPDYIVLARFDRAYAARAAPDFLADLARIGPRRLHVGADFRFGAGQAGDTALLARHFALALAPQMRCAAGEVISSTRIRAALACGQSREAAALLGPTDPASHLAGALMTQDLRIPEDDHDHA